MKHVQIDRRNLCPTRDFAGSAAFTTLTITTGTITTIRLADGSG